MIRIWILSLLVNGFAFGQTHSYTYDDAGRLTSVRYPGGRTVTYTYDKAGNLLRDIVSTPATGANPAFSAAGIVNAASFLPGSVSPGEIVTIFGSTIGPPSLSGPVVNALGFFATFVADTSISFDGVPAPVIYVSAGQTSVIVPYSIAGKTSTQVVVEFQGRKSPPVSVPVAQAAPALFSANSSGKGNGAILNQDNSVNSAANPAAKGSIVVLYGTGEGQTAPAGIDGRIATSIFPKPILPVVVRIGNINAEVLYFGAAPSLVAGVFQINVRIPQQAPSGNVPVLVSFGNFTTQPELTVRVQ